MRFICFFVLVCLSTCANAAVRLPRLIRDSMVLQRDKPINCWGWAAPGEKVTIRFNGNTYNTRTSKDSTWTITLPAMKAGGPYTININQIVLHDVLIGDVWLCSGQSNMVHQMFLHADRYSADIANAHYPQIRHFWIPTLTELKGPSADLPDGYWKSANPRDVRDFSAIAYFFARTIFEKYHIPIGLINASVGGTPIQAWISEEGLKDFPDLIKTVERNKDYQPPHAQPSREPAITDKGLTSIPAWFDPAYSPLHWRPITVPGYWEDQGASGLHGAVWYRKEIDVPASFTTHPTKLVLGRIVDADQVYINGKQVGHTTYMYPQRRYPLPEGTLHAGKNLIVVRVTNQAGKGGFVPDKPYCIVSGTDTLDLKGTWLYKVGEATTPFRPGGGGFTLSAQNSPTALFNAMLAPTTHYPIKGVLWYQGEANTNNADLYAQLMPALIADFRSQWRQPDLPVFYVQLPNFGDVRYFPSESQWAATREAQTKALSIKNTGMAVTIDLGEWNDIHPDRKKDVGERLALLAEQQVYGEKNLIAESPQYKEAKIEGNKIIVSFSNTGSGLTTTDGQPPAEFAIAGADKRFAWAQTRLEANQVIAWNDAITQPRYIRYAWADNPDNPNLASKEGLPASPFRTDGAAANAAQAPPTAGLKDYYKNYFPIGVAVSPQSLKTDEANLILEQFNSVTPENAMKMGPIHPSENQYNWRDADSIVAFAQRNHLKIRGHNLCWHNQAPRWFFTDSAGKQVTKEVLYQRLHDHIKEVVTRYKGKIYAWDVVNEVISDKPDEYFRPSKFYEICGEEFVAKAFQYAHEADPDAILFYNDYNEINATKREKIFRLVKSLKDAGIPIGGLGLQAHWAVNEPSRTQLDSTLSRFSELKIPLQITELDISVYPKEHQARTRQISDDDTAFSATRQKQQEEVYKMCFELFRQYKKVITGVTFWNISDRGSWLDNFPVRGRKDYPLLFDKDLKPKTAFWQVISF
ncbi:MAG: endo-1,4-beta-xylanase [Bacteroidetes bacterium]|nr:endo-1,4-beta-xylanase [Bacteroidota bacterium]